MLLPSPLKILGAPRMSRIRFAKIGVVSVNRGKKWEIAEKSFDEKKTTVSLFLLLPKFCRVN